MVSPESLVFNYDYSNPLDSLRLVPARIPSVGPTQIHVQFLAVPVNPLDFLVLHGRYPVRAKSQLILDSGETYFVPGSDGAARIVEAGISVGHLHPGDIVILRTHCRGTWRTHAILEAEDVLRVPSELDPKLSSLLRMGVMPAYFLLQDYHELLPGDWIIQNAATSTVSHFVSQFAQFYGVNIVSIIRDRTDAEERNRIERSLKCHGASLVLTESELANSDALDGKRIVLALDFVANDKLASAMSAVLTPGGSLITGGFLGPDLVPEVNLRQLLWQRNITLRPFRLSDCLSKRTTEGQVTLVEWFSRLLQRRVLTAPAVDYVRWTPDRENRELLLHNVIQQAQEGRLGQRKVVFVFE